MASFEVLAPLPGTVVSVNVKEGDQVKKNQVLMVLEAMKMENEIVAENEGTVTAVHIAKGDALESGQKIMTIG